MLFLLKKLRYFIAAIIALLLLLFSLLNNNSDTPVKSDFVMNTKRILVIDPGHGGEDGGAVSVTGALESELNLDISKKLDLIMGLCGIPVVMTRESSELSYPSNAKTVKARKYSDMQRRADLVNNI